MENNKLKIMQWKGCDSMLIIDTETTGLEGYPKDRILEIGIAELTDSGEIREVYSSVIRYDDIEEYDRNYVNRDGSKGIWVYRNSDLKIQDTLDAEKDLEIVVKEVRKIVDGKEITSYNVPFDFGRFLDHEPWCLRDIVVLNVDIMDMATERVYELCDSDSIEDKGLQQRLIWEREDSQYPLKWVRSQDAYRVLCPDDPMKLGKQSHRALDDAVMEAWILKTLL